MNSVDENEKRHWVQTTVSLVVTAPDLRPEEVTDLLGVVPTSTREPGPGAWREPDDVDGYWGIDCDTAPGQDFHDQLGRVLELAESRRGELAGLAKRGQRVSVEIYGFAGNDCTLALRPQEVRRIADLGFPLRVAANMNER
ncbi:DUF4279 domain-containing protein [Streptomyces sp. NPDC048718]|uniref:DUF4279 domain-containing protein n=1 Tax=Streptomyces sp. NPDC048718 TaxID=3365587 RepID=UPI0037238CF5